ncbi:CARDB domain-containing protein [Halorubrum rutilum]|uniref:CARDB domain-containing protein n=1 Tax=Halorubrum rutilum TaxID=1364933 RepID=A0ABD6AP92_9EURY|nr:CARDB domain-containing protein [Halorubrum rutilum]
MTRSGSDPAVRSVVVASLAAVLLVAALPLTGGVAVGGAEAAGERTFHGSVGPQSLDGETSVSVAAGDRDEDATRVADAAASQVADADAIRLRNELSLTAEPGTIGVTTRAALPDRVTEFRVTLLSANGAAVEPDGFERAGDVAPGESVWEWDGETATPSLSYAIDANDTVEETGPLGARGTYRFVDTGEWALVRTPRTSSVWSYTGRYEGQVRLTRENVVDGEGAASGAMAFLGPHEERVREAGGQRYRLIVPAAADAEATPDEVFDAFESASTALQVGARDETVFAVAAPTDGVSWGVRGLQLGDADLWVRDAEPAGTADDVWTHEYVHTRQAFRTEASGRWITEASATYYAALFALERGAADFDEFEATLARGERDPDASAVLADPGTWERNPDYTKGALVVGEIDRRLRVATDGSASLATVVRELNAAGEPVGNGDVLDAIEAAAADGADAETAAAVRAEAERLTTAREAPETWDRAAHAEAFGETPARVGYAVAADGVRATGEYRDRPVVRDPVELVAGEALAVDVDVANTGGAAGEYDLALTVDGDAVATRTGSVDAGAETTERFEHAFPEPGEYAVRIAGERLSVVVSEPAPPSVRDVSADPDRASAGDSVRVTATVANDAGLPAGGDVEFRVDGETVAAVPVRLDSNDETTIARNVTLGEPGETGGTDGGDREVTVSVAGPEDEASTTVTVEREGLGGGATDDGAPGFGIVVAAVAVVAAAGLLGRRDP